MASLPSPSQVAGPHYEIYESYYNQIDPQGLGTIAPLDAARFLKKSKLSDIVLGKIWDFSDPTSKGCLDKDGFFVALKLCALAQSGRGISMDNITAVDVPQPKMGEIPKIQNKVSANPTGIDWSLKPEDKAKYDNLFDSLQPINGVLPGSKVQGVLLESKIPRDTLGKIWDLADLDKDGSLSRHEFMIAMHLVYKALEKYAIPNSLPPELLPPGRRKQSQTPQPDLIMAVSRPPVPAQPASVIVPQASRPILPPQPHFSPLNTIVSQPLAMVAAQPLAPVWVVSTEEKAQYDLLFAKTDADCDGFVSGVEIKDVFLQSGVHQSVLALIWSLCDPAQSGKLNNEQFALAMWLINRKMKGIDPPAALTPDMIPPSMRTSQPDQLLQQETVSLGPQSTPELDLLASEIRDLTRERVALEGDVAQKEAELRVKESEVRNLQSELDTLAATLRQLENQKGEAQKRLNDLKTQKSTVESELSDIILEVEKEQSMVDKLRHQAEEQETSLRTQEDELSSKKQELESLKQEEQKLERQQEETKKILENLGKKLDDSQLQISQVKSKVTQLEETQQKMNDAIAACESAVAAGDAALVSDTALSIGPDHRDSAAASFAEEPTTPTAFNGTSESKFDAEFSNDAFANTTSFGNSDPFGSVFGDSKPTTDPFSAFGAVEGKSDPFDPFVNGTSNTATESSADVEDKDPFGCDPFANLHAPTRGSIAASAPPRPTSPSPALPPKKAKQPPPRPAPPRPSAPPTRAAPVPPTPSPDPFASSTGFDDFAHFDSKLLLGPQRPSSVQQLNPARAGNVSSATPSPVPPTEPRYEAFEFSEDPFKNYRYEDVFSIADPFADQFSTDPFSSVSTPTEGFEARFPTSDAFDAYPFDGTFTKADVINGNKSDSSVNVFNGDKSNDKNANVLQKKPFSGESFEWPDSLGVKKGNVNIENAFGCDDAELAWAARESLRLEEHRRQQEEQERSHLEMAIALSKKDNVDKRSLKSLLRRSKNSSTT